MDRPDFIILDSYDDSYKLLAKAIITRISEKQFQLNTDKKTEYRLADVEVTMPHDGSVQEGTTMIYQSLIDLMKYEEGDKITLLVQIEGEYAGYSKVYLPKSSPLDISAFAKYVGVSPKGDVAKPVNITP